MGERRTGAGGDSREARKLRRRRDRYERKLQHRMERKLHKKFHEGSDPLDPPSSPPTPSARSRGRNASDPRARAYRDARRNANRKLSVAIHAVIFGLVLLMLAVVTRGVRVPMIIGVCWGIGFWTHYFLAIVAPRLRRRWIEEEVVPHVEEGVSQQRREVESENVRSLEDLSASIAHEIRNPITAAKSLVQQMGEDPVADSNIEYARVALDELDRVERSISHLLKYARDEEIRLEVVSMLEIVESALDSFRERFATDGVRLEWTTREPAPVRGDREKLRRVVINILGNALDALEEAGVAEPQLELGCGENLAGTEVWVRLRDNGPGIPSESLRKIFSPFYTTKDHGTGLGLALSKKVVDAHGGTLEAESERGGGADFVLTLPKQRGTATPASHEGGPLSDLEGA